MLQKVPDALRLAQLARARRTWEIRKRLGFADAKRYLKIIALAEERCLAGEPEPKPRRVIREASPIDEARIERFQQAHMGRGTWRWFR